MYTRTPTSQTVRCENWDQDILLRRGSARKLRKLSLPTVVTCKRCMKSRAEYRSGQAFLHFSVNRVARASPLLAADSSDRRPLVGGLGDRMIYHCGLAAGRS